MYPLKTIKIKNVATIFNLTLNGNYYVRITATRKYVGR